MDCACSAPYTEIDASKVDALVFSGHKFLGGTCTPGVLIAHKKLFTKKSPFIVGGGCVESANKCGVTYSDNIETKESAGTPNIIGIIKLGYVLDIKDQYKHMIYNNEHEILKYVHTEFTKLSEKYDVLKVIMLNKNLDRRLPIISFKITDLDHNFIVQLLNDLYGIQTRGGTSCCGLLGEFLNNTYNINGWVRITFNYIMSQEDIDFIINAVEFIINNGKSYEKYYKFDKNEDIYVFTNSCVNKN